MENQVCLREERLQKAEVLDPEAAGTHPLIISTVHCCSSRQKND